MADLVEALQNLARQRGRGDASPLIGLRHFAPSEGARISHLPISQRLTQAWISLTGQPFRQHQSLSLSALRRGEPFALIGGGPAARQTLHLLGLEVLRAEPQATALLLAPDEGALGLHQGEIERLSQALAQPVGIAAAGGQTRAALSARVVLATPETLHERLLRHYDRAWAPFWSHLRLLLLADAHRYDGVAAGHLAALLLRAARLAPADPLPQLAATLALVGNAPAALAQISPRPWRIVPVDDAPRPPVTLALWRVGADRARDATALALGLQRAGATVHLTCAPIEARPLQALVGAEIAAISVAASVLPARAQILIGAGVGGAALAEALESGATLVVLLLGDDPIERTIVRLAGQDLDHLPLIDDPPPAWVAPPLNAYVAAQHLVCAASERPLSAAEVRAWGFESIVQRLEDRDELVRLPDAEPLWQPRVGGGNPYERLGLRSAGGPAALARDQQGTLLGQLDPAAYDRWAFPGAALPPLRGGLRVIGRDEEDLGLTLGLSAEARRTLPLRRASARVRDTRERRSVRGREVGWGRVIVEEEIYGYREVSGGNAAAERALVPPLSSSWSAPALWIDLPAAVPAASGQLVGWSLAAALPLRVLCAPSDCVPVYDPEARRIFFVDAQPGGNGLSGWIYDTLEELLPLAYDVALDCRGDALLEPLARADMDWLLALLSRGTEEQRNRGTEEQRNRGTEEQRNRGTEEQRNRGTEEQRNRGTEEPGRGAGEPGSRGAGPGSRGTGEPGRGAGAPVVAPAREERRSAAPEPPLRARPAPDPQAAAPEPGAEGRGRRPEPEVAPAREERRAAAPEPPARARPAPDTQAAAPEPPLRARPAPEPQAAAPEPPARARPAPEPRPEPVERGGSQPRYKRRAEREPPRSAERRATPRDVVPQRRPRDEPPRPAERRPIHQPELPLPEQRQPEPPLPQERRPTARQPEPPLPQERRPTARQPEPPLPQERRPTARQPEPPLPQERQPEPPLPQERRPTARQPEPEAEPEQVLPDAAAMVARLRRLRQQREQRDPAPSPTRPTAGAEPVEPRFHPGDHVHCTPYGEGEVRSSRIADDREILVVRFADHGDLTVDAALSAARLVAAAADPEPDF